MNRHTVVQEISVPVPIHQQQGSERSEDGSNVCAGKKIHWQEITKSLSPYDIELSKQSSDHDGFYVSESTSNPSATFSKHELNDTQGSDTSDDDNYNSLSTPLISHGSSVAKSAGVPVPRLRIANTFTRMLKTNVEPNTSQQNAIQQNTRVNMDEEKMQGNNATTADQEINFPRGTMKTKHTVSLSVKKFNVQWKSDTFQTTSQIDVQYASSAREPILHHQPRPAILQKRKLMDTERPTTSAAKNDQHVPSKQHSGLQRSRDRKALAELISFTRKSPRKRPHVPVYSNRRVKSKKVSAERSVGYRQGCILDLPKKRQLLQRTKPLSNLHHSEPDNNNSADIDMKHSHQVRNKTRSRTRYFSSVGAVYDPPEPQDFREPRAWPANVGLVYAEWPRDFMELEPEPPRPVSDKEISAHHALHYIIAIVAVAAAARRCNGISASEAMVLQYMMCKLGQCFPQDSSTQNEEVDIKQKPSFTSHIYQVMRNIQNIECSDTGSLPYVKTDFLEILELKKSDAEKENATYSSVTEESWMSMVKATMLHITQILEVFDDSKDTFPPQAQTEHLGSGLLQTLTMLLKKLLETISLLYSVVCDTPYEVVEEYVASQTPETILEWMKDMVTDIPST